MFSKSVNYVFRAGGLEKPVLCVEPSPEMLEVFVACVLDIQIQYFLVPAWRQLAWCPWCLPGGSSLKFWCSIIPLFLMKPLLPLIELRTDSGWIGVV